MHAFTSKKSCFTTEINLKILIPSKSVLTVLTVAHSLGTALLSFLVDDLKLFSRLIRAS